MSPDSKDGNEIARSNILPTSDASERKTMAFHAYPHAEKHTEHGLVVRDTIIGFADGLTVPFALTAGLSRLVPLIYLRIYLPWPNMSSSLVF
jgi:hypothetical protein